MSYYPVVCAILAAALFGATAPAGKLLLSGLSPFQLAGLLYLGAAIGVLPLLLRDPQARSIACISRADRGRLLGAIAWGGIFAPVCLLFALQLASAGSVSLWLNLELIATALVGYFWFHDRLGKYGWLAVIGTVLAAGCLSWGEGAAGLAAGGLVALACLGWGVDNHLMALIDGISPAQSTFWKGLVAGTVNLTLGVAIAPYTASWMTTALGLGVGVLAYGASLVLYLISAQSLGATRSQMIFAAAPFFGVIYADVVVGESITLLQYLAMALKLGSLWLLFQDGHQHAHRHIPMAHIHWHRHDDEHHEHHHENLVLANQWHYHWHHHPAIEHSHSHLPDLHHRHEHHHSRSY
jgi:drug/metabolite transporter (DMT)-like permease